MIARLPLTIVLLGLTSFFADVASEMIFPLLPVFLSATLGAAPVFLGLVEGVADATSSLLKLVTGYVAYRVEHRKWTTVWGYGLAALARPLVGLATAPWHVLAIRVTDRVGKGIRSTPRDLIIAAAAPPGEAGRAFGFHRAMDHAGAVAGPLIAAALLALGWSMRTVFLSAAVPSALSVAVVALVRESRAESETAHGESGEARLPPRFTSYIGILLLFCLGNSSDAFLLLRARELGVSVPAIPILWALLHVSKLVSSYLGGGWADRVPRARLISIGWLIYAATYLALAVASSRWQVWAVFLAYGSYYGLTEPAEKALVKDLADGEARGKAFGVYNFTVGASAIPASLLMGWFWQRYGATAALTAGAGLALVASGLLVRWGATHGRQGRPTQTSLRRS